MDIVKRTDEIIEDIYNRTAEITEDIYNSYGSSSGVLFGIPADLRTSVAVIVKLVLESTKEGTAKR